MELVHRIRRKHYEQLKGKTPEEWAAFYAEGEAEAIEEMKALAREKRIKAAS